MPARCFRLAPIWTGLELELALVDEDVDRMVV
jgi:hypothetical protein